MNNAFILKILMNKELRGGRLVNDYGSSNRKLLVESLKKIRKRFGEDNVKECLEMLEQNNYYEVAVKLLDYYDKSYTFSLNKYKKHKPCIVVCETSEPSVNSDLLLNEIKKACL